MLSKQEADRRPPLVSVVIPTWNGERFISETLAGVFNQSWRNFEIIVVDDGSTDGTRVLLESYRDRVRYVAQTHAGQSTARNHGAKLANGKYLAFLDHDDCWEPSYLERTVSYLETCPAVGFLATAMRIITADGIHTDRVIGKRSGGDLYTTPSLLAGDAETVINPVIRKDVFSRSRGYDVSFAQTGDSDLWLRLSFHTVMRYVAEPLLLYRLHSQNLSKNILENAREWLRVFDKFEDEHAELNLPYGRILQKKRAMHLLRMGRELVARAAESPENLREARRALARSIRLDPGQPRAYVYLALSAHPGAAFFYPAWRRAELQLRERLLNAWP